MVIQELILPKQYEMEMLEFQYYASHWQCYKYK